MKKEVLFPESCTAHDYLRLLLTAYPYALEERQVYTFIDAQPPTNPSLSAFLAYSARIVKLRILTQPAPIAASLLTLFTHMNLYLQNEEDVRQTHPFGFDATMTIQHNPLSFPYAHLPLHQIPFLKDIELHQVPLLPLPPHVNLPITKSKSFLYRGISMDPKDFYALCIHVADACGVIFLAKDCLYLASAIAAMYPLGSPATPDFLLIFGLAAPKQTKSYYYDETNQLLIGLVSGDDTMHHIQDVKDMIQTLYNAICLKKHDLPIHASMLSLSHERAHGLVFAGESGCGKSALLYALLQSCASLHVEAQAVYDDHGTWHYLDEEIVSTGGEIGALKNVSHASVTELFQDYHQSLFLQEEKGSLYQILPIANAFWVKQFHKVSSVWYLDTISDESGFVRIDSLEEALNIFLKGPYRKTDGRIASSFFFNPLGPHQQQAATTELIKDFFTILYLQSIPIYILYVRKARSHPAKWAQIAALILREILGNDCENEAEKLYL